MSDRIGSTIELTQMGSTTNPLTPLAEHLVRCARRDAEDLLARADAEASDTVAAARAEADRLVAESRSRGAGDGAAVAAAERATSAREARGLVLTRRRGAADDFRQAARDAVCGLRHDPAYPELVAALRARLAREIGPDARVTELERGGVVGEGGGRRIAYSLDGLADDILERLGPGLEGLWAP